MMRCTFQVKATPTPLMMKGFCLRTHLPRRRIRTRVWMGQKVIQVGVQPARRMLRMPNPPLNPSLVLTVLGSSSFPLCGRLITLTHLLRYYTLRPFGRDIRFPLTSQFVCPLSSRNAITGILSKVGLRLPLSALHHCLLQYLGLAVTQIALNA